MVLLLTRMKSIWSREQEIFDSGIDGMDFAFNEILTNARSNFYADKFDCALTDIDNIIEEYPGHPFAFFARAFIKFFSSDYLSALEDLSSLIELDHSNVDAYLFRGRVHNALGQNIQAIADWRKVFEIDSRLNISIARIGILKLEEEDYVGAAIEFDKLFELNPIRALYSFALLNYRVNNYKCAFQCCNSYIDSEEGDIFSFAYYIRSMCKHKMGDADGAIADMSLFLEISPLSSDGYQSMSEIQLSIGDKTGAISTVKEWIKNFPDQLPLYEYCASIYFDDKDYEKCLAEHNRIVQIFSSLPLRIHRQRCQLKAIFNIGLALEDLDEVIKLHSDIDSLYCDRAHLSFSIREYDAAIADADKCLDLNSNNVEAFSLRAKCFYHTGNYEKSLMDISRVLDSSSDLFDMYCLRADIAMDQERFQEANYDYQQALQLNDDEPWLHLKRAQALEKLHDFNGAIACLDRSLILDDSYSYAFYLRGIYKNIKGDLIDSLQDFAEAVNCNSGVVDDFYYDGLAKAQFLNNDFNGALSSISKAILLNPNDEDFYLFRLKCKRKLDDLISAQADVRKIINLPGNSLENLVKLVQRLNDSSCFKDVIFISSVALYLMPSCRQLWELCGLAYFELNEYEKAIDHFSTAISNELDFSSCLYLYRGRTYELIGNSIDELNYFN